MSREAAIWHDVECGGYEADLPLWRELAGRYPGPVLDVGAGTGRVALALAEDGHRVTALDNDPERVREAAAEVLGIPRRGELSEDEAARFYRFRTDVQDRIEVDQKQGKRVDGAALQKILDEAKLNVVSVNVDYWSDLRSSVFGLTKDQQGNAYVMVGSDQVYLSAIPAAEREQIIKDLLATPGAKVTEQRIAELWVLGGRQNAERDRIQAANAAEAQQTVNAAAPPSTADLQKAEEERVRGIRKLFPSPLYEEADRRRQQQKQAAELKQQRQAEEARREAERVREIRRIWGMPPAQSGGGN